MSIDEAKKIYVDLLVAECKAVIQNLDLDTAKAYIVKEGFAEKLASDIAASPSDEATITLNLYKILYLKNYLRPQARQLHIDVYVAVFPPKSLHPYI